MPCLWPVASLPLATPAPPNPSHNNLVSELATASIMSNSDGSSPTDTTAMFAEIIKQLDHISKKQEDHDEQLDAINKMRDNHGTQLSTINNRMEGHNTRLACMEKVKLDDPEGSMAGTDTRVLGTGTAAQTNYHIRVPPVRTENTRVPRFHKLDFPPSTARKIRCPGSISVSSFSVGSGR